MSGLRPEFRRALSVLARICTELSQAGKSVPIIVGGSAVELFTTSAVMTGDVDLVAADEDGVREALERAGFIKPTGPGELTRGWVHNDLDLSVEIVGTRLMDGNADPAKTVTVEIGVDFVRIISAADLIADRLGQYFSESGGAGQMLAQAIELWTLAANRDEIYLNRRIMEETGGSADLSWLMEQAGDQDQT